MIHYHGTPLTPIDALYSLAGRNFFVSHARPDDIRRVAAIASSFALDNGAFSQFKRGHKTDWKAYYAWCEEWLFPGTWAVIPDVIDAGTQEQDALIREWPHGHRGAPVWHMDEPISRLVRLTEQWPRVCIGSSGECATIGTPHWWAQMSRAMRVVCNDDGQPLVKLHGLRMLNPEVFSRFPFASADSTNIARNIGIDQTWRGNYMPPTKEMRAQVMRSRIESQNAPPRWSFSVPDTLIEQGSLL